MIMRKKALVRISYFCLYSLVSMGRSIYISPFDSFIIPYVILFVNSLYKLFYVDYLIFGTNKEYRRPPIENAVSTESFLFASNALHASLMGSYHDGERLLRYSITNLLFKLETPLPVRQAENNL